MEVHNERRAPIAPLDLIVPRGSNEPAAERSFRDCLRPSDRPVSASSPDESNLRRPVAADRPADEAKVDPPANESQPSGESAEAVVDSVVEPSDDEPDDAEEPAEPIVSHLHASVSVSAGEEILAAPAGVEDAENSVEPAAIAEDEALPLTAMNAVEEIAADDPHAGFVACIATLPNDAALPADETPNSPKSKRSGRSPAVPAQAVDPPVEADMPKTTVPGNEKPENTGILGPPKVAPLDPTQADDVNRSAAKETSDTSTTEFKPVAALADATSVAPAVEASAAGAPTSTPDASLSTTAASKPPAVLLKSASGSADAGPRAGDLDPAKFLQRVVKAFESAQQRDSEVRLRLHPAELGALSIEVKVQDNVLTARVQAETPEARAAIVDNLPALRERLAEQGIRIEKFDVDLMDHSDRRQHSLDEQNRQRESRQVAATRSPNRAISAGAVSAPVMKNRAAGPGGLNVII